MGITVQPDSIIAAALGQFPATGKLHCADGEALRYGGVDSGKFHFDELVIKPHIMTGYGDGSLQRLNLQARNVTKLGSVKYVFSGQTMDAARSDVPPRVHERGKLAHDSPLAVDDDRSHLHHAVVPKWK